MRFSALSQLVSKHVVSKFNGKPRSAYPNRRTRRRGRTTLETLESRLALDGTPSGGTGGGDPTLLQLVVSTTFDEVDGNHSPGDLSLREAVILANAHVGDVEIEVPAGLYRLTIPRPSLNANAQNDAATGDLFIRNEFGTTRIAGASAGTTIVDANGLDRAFTIARGEVTLASLTIRGGNATEIGTGTLGSPRIQGNGGAIFVNDSLHLIDSIVETSHAPGLGGGIYVQEGSGLTIEGSTIRANWAMQGGGLWLEEDANVAIHNSQFLQNTATDAGGGMYLREPIVEMTGTTIRGNCAAVSGGGIHVNRSDLNIVSTTISENFAGIQGGGIYLASDFPVEIASSTISSNTTGPDGSGGGIYIHYGDSVTISDTDITHNVAGATSSRGGGIDAAPANPFDVTSVLQITGGAIANNSAHRGGGLSIGEHVRATIDNVTFRENTASQHGGALDSLAQSLLVTNSRFEANAAVDTGGGINVGLNGQLSLISSMLTQNQAESGGAIALDYGTHTIASTIIEANTAEIGGGIFVEENSYVDVSDTVLRENVAHRAGGAFVDENAFFTFEGGAIERNRAATFGGGLAFDYSGKVRLANTTISQNTAGIDGGGLNVRGSYIADRIFEVDNVQLRQNTAGQFGGGAYFSDASLHAEINAVHFIENSARSGAGVAIVDGPSITISESTINSNLAAASGGGVLNDSSTLLLDHTEVRGNQILVSVDNPFAEATGGGILNIATTGPANLSLASSQVIFNTIVAESMEDAAAGGGGIANISNVLSGSDAGPPQAIITIDGSAITRNSVTARLRAGTIPSSSTTIRAIGGGIFSSANVGNTAITIRGSSIEDNLAEAGQGRNESHPTVLGGGIYYQALNESTLSILDTRIDGNRAQNDGSAGARGGGLYYDLDDFADEMNARLEIERTTISDNTVYGSAPTLGGGAYLNGKSISILQSTIAGNSAVTENSHGSTGGGIYALGTATGLVGGELLIEGTSISGNDAARGGGIVIGALLETRITNTTISNNSASLVGGGLITAAREAPVLSEPNTILSNVDVIANTAKSGAGIFNEGNHVLHMNVSTIADNIASIEGGGLKNVSSTTRIVDSEVRGNRVVGIGGEDQPMYGGGILNTTNGSPASVEIINSRIVDNSLEARVPAFTNDDFLLLGAGIANLSINHEATIRISKSEVLRNSISFGATGDFINGDVAAMGGGIYSGSATTRPATVIVQDSTIAENRVTIPHVRGVDSVLSSGGGIHVEGSSSLTVNYSTIANNIASATNHSSGEDTVATGGGITFASRTATARMVINHATISGNSVSAINPADGEGFTSAIGGGISMFNITVGPASSPAEVAFSTIAFNRAYAEIDANLPDDDDDPTPQPQSPLTAGIYGRGSALSIYQSLGGSNESTVVERAAGSTKTNYSPAVGYTDLGYNLLVGQESNAWLGKLAYNGGTTQTHALLPGSPAIDAGNPAFTPGTYNPPLTLDQRGQPRVLDGGDDGAARIDIGAYEYSRTFLFGDLNGDGQVGVRDLIVVQQHLGHTGPTYAQGDLNADGLVDAADVGIIAAHLGNRLPTATSASAGAVVTRAVSRSTANAQPTVVTAEAERPAAREARRRPMAASSVDRVFAAASSDSTESIDAGKLRVRRRATM